MTELVVPYQIKDDYYLYVDNFAEEFIDFARTLNLSDLSECLKDY